MKKALFFTLILCLACSAFAQRDRKRGSGFQMDKNGDFQIDKEEMKAWIGMVKEKFPMIKKRMGGRMAKNPMFKAFIDADKNKDGKLDDQEASALAESAKQHFAKRSKWVLEKFDFDKDGKLSAKEQEAARKQMAKFGRDRRGGGEREEPKEEKNKGNSNNQKNEQRVYE